MGERPCLLAASVVLLKRCENSTGETQYRVDHKDCQDSHYLTGVLHRQDLEDIFAIGSLPAKAKWLIYNHVCALSMGKAIRCRHTNRSAGSIVHATQTSLST